MSSSNEQRRHERRPFLAEATLRRDGGGDARAHAVDLGRGGIGIFTPAWVPPGEDVELAVAGAALAGRVAAAYVLPEGNRLSIEFHRALAPEDLEALIAGARPPIGATRAGAVRVAGPRRRPRVFLGLHPEIREALAEARADRP